MSYKFAGSYKRGLVIGRDIAKPVGAFDVKTYRYLKQRENKSTLLQRLISFLFA